jgi:peptidoglycan/xylan/chitin deacetylase (PgdA/CDA1 family)
MLRRLCLLGACAAISAVSVDPVTSADRDVDRPVPDTSAESARTPVLTPLLATPAPPPTLPSTGVEAPAGADSGAGPDEPAVPVLYLSFDDGPDPLWTPRLLELLDRYAVTATFFVVGRAAVTEPGLLRDIAARGHRIANHTYSHLAAGAVSPETFAADVARTDAALTAILGVAPAGCLRPPYGSSPERAARATGKEIVMWDVDPQDWARPGSSAIVARVRAQLRSGAVLLFHDGGGNRSQTLAALEVLLAEWVEDGYRFGLLCPRQVP